MSLSDAGDGSLRGAGDETRRPAGPPPRRGRTADDIMRLQGCINDLVSLLALPALWRGRDLEQLLGTVLEALVRMLRLDFACALFRNEGDAAHTELVRLGSAATSGAWRGQIVQAFHPWLESDPERWPPTVPNPSGVAMRRSCRVASVLGQGPVSSWWDPAAQVSHATRTPSC